MLLSFQRPSRAPMEGTPPRTCALSRRLKPPADRTGQYSAPRGPLKASAQAQRTGEMFSIAGSHGHNAARRLPVRAATGCRPLPKAPLLALTQAPQLALADLQDRTVEPRRREIEVLRA